MIKKINLDPKALNPVQLEKDESQRHDFVNLRNLRKTFYCIVSFLWTDTVFQFKLVLAPHITRYLQKFKCLVISIPINNLPKEFYKKTEHIVTS